MRWLQRMAGRAALVVALIGVALILAEVVLRLVDYRVPQWYQLDPQLGWSLRPHKHGWYAGDDGRRPVIINGAGFRDRDHELDKPAPVYRIAILGDEYSEAMGVRLADTWWARLEPELQHCYFEPGKLIEVLNFAVGGYGTAQELVLLQSTVMRYAPDLVLVQFSPDDVIDNSRALTPRKLRPFYFLDAHGVARIDDSFATAPEFERYMQTRYRLAAEIGDHLRSFQLLRELTGPFITPAHAHSTVTSGPQYDEAWRVTEALLAKMNDYARRNGAALAIVAVPPRQAAQALGYPEQRLEALGKRLQLPVIALGGLPGADYTRAGLWTPQGHAIASRYVAARLCPATPRPG